MSVTNWKILNGKEKTDLSLKIRKDFVDSHSVSFNLIGYSGRWENFDIEFLYRINNRDRWNKNACILETDAKYLINNNLYGLKCSKEGTENKIVWNYAKNNLLHYSTPQIKINILPRIRTYGKNHSNHVVTEQYGPSFIDLKTMSEHNIIGINNDGNYLGVASDSFFVLIDGQSFYSYNEVSDPQHAIDIDDKRYLVADTGNDRIIELDEQLNLISEFSFISPVYIDYCEDKGTILVTNSNGLIAEIQWD